MHEQTVILTCDSVWTQFWRKSDDHTARRQYQMKHSRITSSNSSVMNYEMLNLVWYVFVFWCLFLVSAWLWCLLFMILLFPKVWQSPRYLKCSSLHLFLQQTTQPSFRSLELLSVTTLPLLHHVVALTISRVILTVLALNAMLRTHLILTLSCH